MVYTVVGVNWLMFQECRRAVFRARYYSSWTLRSFFRFWKMIGYADDSTLMAVVPSPGVKVIVAESLIRDLGRVSEWCYLLGDEIECE